MHSSLTGLLMQNIDCNKKNILATTILFYCSGQLIPFVLQNTDEQAGLNLSTSPDYFKFILKIDIGNINKLIIY